MCHTTEPCLPKNELPPIQGGSRLTSGESLDVNVAGTFESMAMSVFLPLLLPWLDRSRVKSIRYRGWIYKFALSTFVVSFMTLGWLGLQPAEGLYVLLARIFSILYFAFFLLMPYYTAIDKTKPVPERVTYHG